MKRERFVKLALLLSWTLISLTSLPQTPLSHDQILSEVRSAARRHAESGAGKDSSYVLEQWGQNSAGVSRQEIVRAYDEEYTQAKQEQEKRDWIPKAGWIVAVLLFIALFFLEKLKQALGKLMDFAGDKLLALFAGLPVFYRLALKRYCRRMVQRYAQLKIPFRPERPLDLDAVFVPLKVAGETTAFDTLDAYAALRQNTKLLVKGSPGAGKSILLRHIALTYARQTQSALIRFGVPILVELGRLNDPTVTLRSELTRELVTKGFSKPDYFLSRSLKRGSLLLLLDGMDEISATQRPRVTQQIGDLIEEFPDLRLIVTCRTQVYEGELDTVVDRTLEIQDFSDQQILRFLRSWAQDMRRHGKSVDQLMKALFERPTILALARNPLMLTIIAWLYTDTTAVLPQSRSEFYRKATELLLYDWKPETNRFQLVPKQMVLRELALYFQDNADQQQQDRRSVDVQTVLQCIARVLPKLAIDSKESSLPLLDEIVKRSALLLEIDGGERYQFAHLTLQEYFAASAMRSDPQGLIQRFQRSPDAWREVVKLWCGLDEDATELIKAVHKIDPLTGFECLADAQKVDIDVANEIIDVMKRSLLHAKPDTAIAKAFGAVASSLSSRGREVFSWLSTQNASQALEALSYANLPQAAKVLVSLYDKEPAVPLLLCRLGELAVPELSAVAGKGNATAVHNLMAIGTPGAAEALLPLLWHSSFDVATRAAFSVAALFQSPEVFAALQEAKVQHPQALEWAWQPFYSDSQLSISLVAGRVVALLQSAHEIADLPKRTLDPRLVLPACAEAGSELTLHDSFEGASQLSISDLYHTITHGREASKEDKIVIGPDSTETLQKITFSLFERLLPSVRWRFLFNCLELPIQAELIRGISSTRLPTREDWANILRPVSYKARRAWHLWTLFIFLQAVSIGNLLYLLRFRHSFTLYLILFCVVIGTELLFHLVGMLMFSRAEADDMFRFILFVGLSPFSLNQVNWRSAAGLVRQKWLDNILTWLVVACLLLYGPITLGALFLTLRNRYSISVAVLVVVAFIGCMTSLWMRARHLDRLSRNPLSGLRRFVDPVPEKEAAGTLGSRIFAAKAGT